MKINKLPKGTFVRDLKTAIIYEITGYTDMNDSYSQYNRYNVLVHYNPTNRILINNQIVINHVEQLHQIELLNCEGKENKFGLIEYNLDTFLYKTSSELATNKEFTNSFFKIPRYFKDNKKIYKVISISKDNIPIITLERKPTLIENLLTFNFDKVLITETFDYLLNQYVLYENTGKYI